MDQLVMSGLFPAGAEEGEEEGGGGGGRRGGMPAWGCGLRHGVIQGSSLPSPSGRVTDSVSFLRERLKSIRG